MEYKDCVIICKTGSGIVLSGTSLTVGNNDKMIYVYDGNDIMAIVPLDEIKAVLFCDMADAEELCKVLGGAT